MKRMIGLFGTCGSSKWRKGFEKIYTELGISFFNPEKENWQPEYAVKEAKHLAEDQVLLFPVTGETYGVGSLCEIGFAVSQAVKDDQKYLVVMIEENLAFDLKDEVARKESLRARTLVREHLKKLSCKNIYLVENLEQMLQISIDIYSKTAVV